MPTLQTLQELMSITPDMTTPEIEDRFTQIAQMLFSRFAIQKGDKRYLFKEIEFYFYNKNHRDIITHPRISKPLYWYINDFGGIDLNFTSNIETHHNPRSKTAKYHLNNNAYFGGILIRQLITDDGNQTLTGPFACAHLFRHFNAIENDHDMPKLVELNNNMVGYIREPRINILTPKHKLEQKTDYLLTQYTTHPDNNAIYQDFENFKDKRYRYIRCSNLMHDKETNIVYLSPLLKNKEYGHPEFYQQLTTLLKELNIEVRELKSTNDYWARDYMPIQLVKNEFLKYRYYPDYLTQSKDPEDIKTITDSTKVLRGMGINCRSTSLIIDGGNMVPCGPYIVITDKVFTENGHPKNHTEFKAILESELGHPIIIIPWTLHGDPNDGSTDKYGHSDGFIKWCGGNHILMGNHGDEYPEEATSIRQILELHGFIVTEMHFNNKVPAPRPDLNWAYINFLQVGHNIIMPKFNIPEDNIAKQYIHEAFPYCKISQIDMTEIAAEGGALHCLTWNIHSH